MITSHVAAPQSLPIDIEMADDQMSLSCGSAIPFLVDPGSQEGFLVTNRVIDVKDEAAESSHNIPTPALIEFLSHLGNLKGRFLHQLPGILASCFLLVSDYCYNV